MNTDNEMSTINPTPTPTPVVVEDCFGLLKLYSDGSIFRSKDISSRHQIQDDGSVVWKDSLFHQEHNLYLRLYKPANASDEKLPILYYLHPGGFCFGSRDFPTFHNSCLSLCSRLRVIVVSPDHRLAPEHRLPAALDDVYNGLKWLQSQAGSVSCEPWLCEGGDLDRVFIFGESSGGNLAHHLAIRFGRGAADLEPVRVRGYVLLSPFFGGTVKTKSEVERPCEAFWTQEIYDRFWRLSIPNGSSKDHPLVNPAASLDLGAVDLDPVLVLVGGSEILTDRVKEYAEKLRQMGNHVVYEEFEGKQHAFFTDNPYSEEVEDMVQAIRCFISKNSVSRNLFVFG